MKARNIDDLENIILKDENKYLKEKILHQEKAYYYNNYYGYGGHVLQLKGKTWIYFYNYLHNYFCNTFSERKINLFYYFKYDK